MAHKDKIRFVFQVAYGETSRIASKRRASEEASKDRSDQGVASSGQSRELEVQTWTGASSSSQDQVPGMLAKAYTLESASPVLDGRRMKKATRLPGKKKANRKARRLKKNPARS